MSARGSAKHLREVCGVAYQIAGGLLLLTDGDDPYTEGQRDRLTQLLLDTLSEPDRYTVEVLYRLRDLALKP